MSSRKLMIIGAIDLAAGIVYVICSIFFVDLRGILSFGAIALCFLAVVQFFQGQIQALYECVWELIDLHHRSNLRTRVLLNNIVELHFDLARKAVKKEELYAWECSEPPSLFARGIRVIRLNDIPPACEVTEFKRTFDDFRRRYDDDLK